MLVAAFPVIARYAFVYHFKSVTVKSSNYQAGSRVETRNNLSLYHSSATYNKQTPPYELYSDLQGVDELTEMKLYPPVVGSKRLVIGLAVSNPKLNPRAGDVFTAKVRFSNEICVSTHFDALTGTGSILA